jgi:hypothetical protein
MTPFEQFFAENYPHDVDELWKKKLAACWNAALDAAGNAPFVSPDICESIITLKVPHNS